MLDNYLLVMLLENRLFNLYIKWTNKCKLKNHILKSTFCGQLFTPRNLPQLGSAHATTFIQTDKFRWWGMRLLLARMPIREIKHEAWPPLMLLPILQLFFDTNATHRWASIPDTPVHWKTLEKNQKSNHSFNHTILANLTQKRTIPSLTILIKNLRPSKTPSHWLKDEEKVRIS